MQPNRICSKSLMTKIRSCSGSWGAQDDDPQKALTAPGTGPGPRARDPRDASCRTRRHVGQAGSSSRHVRLCSAEPARECGKQHMLSQYFPDEKRLGSGFCLQGPYFRLEARRCLPETFGKRENPFSSFVCFREERLALGPGSRRIWGFLRPPRGREGGSGGGEDPRGGGDSVLRDAAPRGTPRKSETSRASRASPCRLPWLEWDSQRLARPSDPGALLARKTAVSRPAGVFWMRGASICGAGASAQLEERWQEVCVGGCWRVRSCRPPRQPRSAWTGRCLGGCCVAHSNVRSDSSEAFPWLVCRF